MGSNSSKPIEESSEATGITSIELSNKDESSGDSYPIPKGDEYDLMDSLSNELPQIIDDESKRQVEEYKMECDNGNGSMVSCFSYGEYISLFERKHEEAMKLFENTCFRDINDKSPNGVEVDKTMAYPPSCYNLGRFRMTGKGRTEFNRNEAYELFDRGCRGTHDPSCVMQAKMLLSPSGSLGDRIPHDPPKAMSLLERVCNNGDSISCFTLGTMLLRGAYIDQHASNATPSEARGIKSIKERSIEANRHRNPNDGRVVINRDPKRAEQLFLTACDAKVAASCYNLAVMYKNGDDGVPSDQDKAKQYQEKTEEVVKMFGGFV